MENNDAQAEYKQAGRIRHTFTLGGTPALEKLAKETGISKVTLKELTAGDELMATKRCSSDPVRLQWELPLQALVSVNEEPLSLSNGSADKFWELADPRVRQLIIRAYGKVHNPETGAAEDFLKSATVEVG